MLGNTILNYMTNYNSVLFVSKGRARHAIQNCGITRPSGSVFLHSPLCFYWERPTARLIKFSSSLKAMLLRQIKALCNY